MMCYLLAQSMLSCAICSGRINTSYLYKLESTVKTWIKKRCNSTIQHNNDFGVLGLTFLNGLYLKNICLQYY